MRAWPARLPLSLFLLTLPLSPALSAGQALLHDAEEANVNQRYVVESVSFAGQDLSRVDESHLPPDLRERLGALIGQPADAEALDALSADLRRQLHFRAVTGRLSKGTGPGLVHVNFEAAARDPGFDVSLPRFLYHSQQGFSGELDASLLYHHNVLTAGIVSNGDDLTERYSGIVARFQSAVMAPGELRAEVAFEDYHEQWNAMTLSALGPADPEPYRSRWNVAPGVSFRPFTPVTITLGASFERIDSEIGGAAPRSANAATLDVRAVHRFARGGVRHQVEGRYNLRIAARALGSGYSYARHFISFRYLVRSGRHSVSDELLAGSIAGDAPFYERFALGSSSTLRGWDRYEIDPLGGSRVVHNEVTYSYRVGGGAVEAFYDAGALWQFDWAAQLRHSLGAGYRRSAFFASLAFPLRGRSIEPVFMAGMNY